MNAVPELGPRHGAALLDDILEAAVGGHLPLHLDRLGGHAVPDLERLRREPGPDDEPVRQRIAGRNAELEGVGREDRLGQSLSAEQRHRRERAETLDQPAARNRIALLKDAAHWRRIPPPVRRGVGTGQRKPSACRGFLADRTEPPKVIFRALRRALACAAVANSSC